MATKIRFCEHNKGKGKTLRKLEEQFPDLNIKVKSCVKQCGTCRETPMAVIDKNRVTGRDGDDLYRNVVALIRKDGTAGGES